MNTNRGWVAMLLTAVCTTAGAATVDVTVTDSAGRALPDAVAWLKPVDGNAATPAAATYSIDQVQRRFVPAVSVIATGTAVRFPNSDDVRHSVYSFSPSKTFTLKLYSGTPAEPVVFDKPGLVTLGCNIHDTMLAYVKVVDTPYFGKSSADGRIRMASVPQGRYQLMLWHPWLDGAEPAQPLLIDSGNAAAKLALSLRPPPAGGH